MKEPRNNYNNTTSVRYDKFIYEDTNTKNSKKPQTPFYSIISKLEEINKIAKIVEPYLNSTFPIFKCKVANLRDGKLVIITTNSSAIRYFRIHKNKALNYIKHQLSLNNINDIELKISPLLSISSNILPSCNKHPENVPKIK